MENSRYERGGEGLYKINDTYFRSFATALNEAGVSSGRVSMDTVAQLVAARLSPEHQEIVTRRLVGQSFHDIAVTMEMDEGIVESVINEAPYHILPAQVPSRSN